MKKNLFLFSFFLIFSLISAQTYHLNVNLKDGTKVTYEIKNISKIDFDNVTSVKDLQQIQNVVKSFKLMQNYPNPFNPSTTIQYEIPDKSNVEVTIYDLTGRVVNRLVNQYQQAGLHSVVWNGKNQFGIRVASGFYIYSVKYKNNISSKKMILLK
ncbi:hypothetical protein MNBD_IGNAVI01-2793 [hydrothermal vent metagenome]|uniref:FlgD/Vpr Ig-like domain-containing protein n=1 Tax=hydrothermal vent metagenome TaxID=652676 RepID=A0A3B1CSK6_9ZZZZ